MELFSGGKMFKRNGLIILVVFGLLFLASCTRKSVEDPDMDGGAGFKLQISGTATIGTAEMTERMLTLCVDFI